MMLKIEFGGIRGVLARPQGLFVALFVNWLVKPFSMEVLGWVFVKLIFSGWFCMVTGVALGTLFLGLTKQLGALEFGRDSHVNAPIAILIWLFVEQRLNSLAPEEFPEFGPVLFILLIMKLIPITVSAFGVTSLRLLFPADSRQPQVIIAQHAAHRLVGSPMSIFGD